MTRVLEAGSIVLLESGSRAPQALAGPKKMAHLAVNTTALRTLPFFSVFSDDELQMLVPHIQHRQVSSHAFMLRAGETTNTLYVILSGKAKIVINNDQGREVTIATLGPAEFFGEMSLIDEKPHSASVQALVPCQGTKISAPPNSTPPNMMRRAPTASNAMRCSLRCEGIASASTDQVWPSHSQVSGWRPNPS